MNSNMSSQRQLRFSELIRSLISECFLVEDFYNFSFNITSITISYVKMSKDLRIANIYLMPLGGENKNKIIDEINKQKHVFQKFLSKAKLNSKSPLRAPSKVRLGFALIPDNTNLSPDFTIILFPVLVAFKTK